MCKKLSVLYSSRHSKGAYLILRNRYVVVSSWSRTKIVTCVTLTSYKTPNSNTLSTICLLELKLHSKLHK